MKKRGSTGDEKWCPECEKLDKHVRLEGDCCPECHYMYLTRRA